MTHLRGGRVGDVRRCNNVSGPDRTMPPSLDDASSATGMTMASWEVSRMTLKMKLGIGPARLQTVLEMTSQRSIHSMCQPTVRSRNSKLERVLF
eukprot:1584729-Amphidinium_carterae.3